MKKFIKGLVTVVAILLLSGFCTFAVRAEELAAVLQNNAVATEADNKAEADKQDSEVTTKTAVAAGTEKKTEVKDEAKDKAIEEAEATEAAEEAAEEAKKEADDQNAKYIALAIVAQEEKSETQTATVNIYSSKDDKIKYIMMESFSKCTVCKDLDQHQEHMVMDAEMREYLFYPDAYFEKKDKEKSQARYAKLLKTIEEVKAFTSEQDEEESENSEEASEVADNEKTESEAVKAESEAVKAEENKKEELAEPSEKQAVDSEATAPTGSGNVSEPAGETKTVDAPVADTMTDEAAVNEAKAEDIKPEETKTEEPKVEEAKTEEPKVEEAKPLENRVEELEEFYRLVEAEAGIESVRCREMVANVVMNRVKSEKFPNTVHDVIYAPGAFTVTKNNAMNRVTVSQETIDAVNRVYYGEIKLDENVFFFRNNHFFKWCKPVVSINHTYFSTYYN